MHTVQSQSWRRLILWKTTALVLVAVSSITQFCHRPAPRSQMTRHGWSGITANRTCWVHTHPPPVPLPYPTHRPIVFQQWILTRRRDGWRGGKLIGSGLTFCYSSLNKLKRVLTKLTPRIRRPGKPWLGTGRQIWQNFSVSKGGMS